MAFDKALAGLDARADWNKENNVAERDGIWRRLSEGMPLTDVARIDGRVDLRGLVAPQPSDAGRVEGALPNVRRLNGIVSIQGGAWENLDLSDAKLSQIRFHGTRFRNCRFADADCSRWRMWGVQFRECSFERANLSGTSMGGVDNGLRNVFDSVDFSRADMVGTGHFSADMSNCLFVNTELDSVDFAGTRFSHCKFEGELSDVTFSKYGFRGEALPPNEMKQIDFRNAKFDCVQFRDLQMSSDVEWPTSPEHVVVRDYGAVVDLLIDRWKERGDLGSRQLVASFGVRRKFVPPQAVGVINIQELLEIGGASGKQAVADLRRVIESRAPS